MIRLSDDLALPVRAITETFGILAARGAGKSNTAAVMAEEMFHAKLPFVVVDPARAWWGLRASRDGKGPGLPIPIFGGRHGDVPLERTGGTLVADLVVAHRLSCILDITEFDSEGAKKAFLLDFARRLYQKNEEPLHLFLEEADDYIPQRPMRDEAQLLRAWENIVRRGRNRGLGMTLITQRSAAINKSVLTQVGTLIAMRTTGPQDRNAIEEWLKYHDQSREIVASLPGLADGEAWVWSPQFLGKTVRVHVRLRSTFDSGATPKAMESKRAPATLADVDLASVKTKMAATIERAKAEDPKALRAELAAVKAELARVKAAPSVKPVKETRVEVPVLKDAQITRLEALLEKAVRLHGMAVVPLTELANMGIALSTEIHAKMATVVPIPPSPVVTQIRREQAGVDPPRALQRPTAVMVSRDPAPVSQRILNVLAELEQLGAARPGRELVAFLAGYSNIRSKSFMNAMGGLRTQGLIDYPNSDTVVLTPEGRVQARPPERPRTAPELHARIIAMLGGTSGRILAPLIEAYPRALPREAVAQGAGYENLRSKGFMNAVGRLRTLGFVDYPDRASMIAMPVLFMESAGR